MTSQSTILPEVWTLIGVHLPQRHLYKLLCTSKQVRDAVDNHDYWTHVAAQLIWRDCECMEIHPCGPCTTDVMPRVGLDLYDIPRTDGDYQVLMQRFFVRMEQMREIYTKGAQQMVDEGVHVCLFGNNDFGPAWWLFWFNQPLSKRNVHFFVVTATFNNIGLKNDESGIPQKELARRKTLAALAEAQAVNKSRKVLCTWFT